MSEREYKKEIHNLTKENSELKVVIDTLQSALLTTEKYLKNHKDYNGIFTTSAKWSMNYNRKLQKKIR